MDDLRDPAVQMVLHGFFAVLFARSAIHKWRDPAAFRAALRAYEILPPRATAPAAHALTWIEAAVAAALLLPGVGAWPAGLGACLLVLYCAAMALAWWRGLREIDCGCGAPGAGRPIGRDLMTRNALLAALLLVTAWPAMPRDLGWLDLVAVLAAGIALLMLHEALDQGLRQLRVMQSWRTAPGQPAGSAVG